MKIKVTDTVRLIALLKTLSPSQLREDSEFVGAHLLEDWYRITGLRRSDLDPLLAYMVRRGQLIPRDDSHHDYTLTRSGADYLRHQYRHEHGFFKRLRAHLVLIYALHRYDWPIQRKHLRQSDPNWLA